METIFDWVSVAIFGGLVVLFLQRSTAEEEPKDHIMQYFPPIIGCAIANYLGNHHQEQFGAALIIGVLVYVAVVLKPFNLKF